MTLDAKVINVGLWDYQYHEINTDDLSRPLMNIRGDILGYEQKPADVIASSPLPEKTIVEDITGMDSRRAHSARGRSTCRAPLYRQLGVGKVQHRRLRTTLRCGI
ncbi:MAG TPA: hypothetical protein VEA17_17245 [Bordetella sp.]|nr:hypothetical protein [Bordetella sp.]